MVYGIGYVRIETPVLSDWEDLAVGVLGMVADRVSQDRLLLRIDERAYRFDLRTSTDGETRLAYGIEMRSAADTAQALEKLEKAGVSTRWGSDEECQDRLVKGLLLCADPSGNPLELFYGQEQVLATKPGQRPTITYVTGDMGAGHLVMGVPDVTASVDFYCDVLGFEESEWFESKGIVFMRCNGREHSLAVMPSPTAKFAHIMLEVESIDDVGIVYDACQDRDLVTKTLGRHTNDRSISFYFTTPSGFEIEYGCGSMVVDDETWTVRKIVEPASVWGHRRMKPSP